MEDSARAALGVRKKGGSIQFKIIMDAAALNILVCVFWWCIYIHFSLV